MLKVFLAMLAFAMSDVVMAMAQYVAEAEYIAELALAIWEQKLGKYHPNVAQSLNNLAEFYHAALESLPFAVLVTAPPPQDTANYQQIAWLSRTWATVNLPSVSSLKVLRTMVHTNQAFAKPLPTSMFTTWQSTQKLAAPKPCVKHK